MCARMVKVSNTAPKVVHAPYLLSPPISNDDNDTIFSFTVLHAAICYLYCSPARGAYHGPRPDRYQHQLNHTTALIRTPYHVSPPLPRTKGTSRSPA